MATLAAVTNMPALALLGEDGKLERSTEPFRRWYEGKEDLCLQAPELKRVLDGEANAAVLKLDGIAVDIAAMADRSGGRHILLTLPTEELPSLGDAGGALLDGALDESPALVWLKDLDGRYVRANARFTALLGTSEDRLIGRTDAELPPAETVDGPRVHERGDDDEVEEPLQLEYVVGPFQGRDALVALRFPVGDRQGVPILVCGVAAPSSQADVARSEAARLLRIERWSRLDADSVLAELLAEWDLLPDARGRALTPVAAPEIASGAGDPEHQAAVAEARAERATAIAERDSALNANGQLTDELQAAQTRLAELERALQDAREDSGPSDAEAMLAAQAAELERGLTRERERAQELERSLTTVRERLGDDAEAARVEVQRARADAEAARTEVERARADADAARVDLEKARADADGLRAAASAEREAAANAAGVLEREVKQARDQLAALERQQGADDSGAQLRAAEKARIAAEGALADAVGERDSALKARAALAGELEQERKLLAGLQQSSVAAEERIRDLVAAMERERVRAEGLEQAQTRAKELETELRAAAMRADKAEVELGVATSRAHRAESELHAAVARMDEARGADDRDASAGQLQSAEKARAAAEAELVDAVAERDGALKARVVLEAELQQERQQCGVLRESSAAAEERIRALAADMERERIRADGLEQAQARAHELEAELRIAAMRADKAEVEFDVAAARVQKIEKELDTALARTENANAELRAAAMRADKAEIELDSARGRIEEVERQLEVGQGRIGALEAEVRVGRALADELEEQLESSRARIDELEGEVHRMVELEAAREAEQGRIDELERELGLARTRAGELEGELEVRRARIDELEDELESARAVEVSATTEDARVGSETTVEDAESEPAPAVAETPKGDLSGEPPSASAATELATLEAVSQITPTATGGVSWQATAKRTLSASLARESVWRNVLKETVQVLGSEGGWDTVTAWLPDNTNGLGCAAIWSAHRGLERFESLTLDVPLRRDGSLLDQALQAPHLTWLTDLDTVDDERLQTAAAHGMHSALLLPVRTGNTTIGLLELLTHDTIEPDAQIALSLEASALQLGRFGHLLSLGSKSA
ncbi:MAG: PAS domain-containing protein [Solirubrobacteraceae bacterium]